MLYTVRSLVKGGEADLDGRICVNDTLLKIDGANLAGLEIDQVAVCIDGGGRRDGGIGLQLLQV